MNTNTEITHTTVIGPYHLELTLYSTGGEARSQCEVSRKVRGEMMATDLDYIDYLREFQTDGDNLDVTTAHRDSMLKWATAHGY
jgi:hypothetical protein